MERDLPVEFTSASELRALFNEFLLPRVRAGEISEIVLYSDIPSPRSGQPPGALSQTLGYFEAGEKIAEAHRFLLKSGELGGSGLPDPKGMVHEGTLLLAE